MRGERRKQEELTAANDSFQLPLASDGESVASDTEGVELVDVSNYKPRRIPAPTWRECIKKIWEVDPLTCPHCLAEMKIISFIVEPKLVRKILEHLKLWVNPPVRGRPPPARAAPLLKPDHKQVDEITYVPIDDGWPQYEEPFIEVD